LDSANPKTTNLSFAEVLQGFNSLSVSEKKLFLTVISQTDKNLVSETAVKPAVGGSNILPPGAPVPAGHTRDPKTGKVFKLSPKVERSAEYLQLEKRVKDAVGELREFSKTVEEFDEHNNIVRLAGGQPITPDKVQEYASLLEALELAKSSKAAYKAAHPDEFSPPRNWNSAKAEPRKHVVLPGKVVGPSHQPAKQATRGKPTGTRGKPGRGGFAIAPEQSSGGPPASAGGSTSGW
jgi:hypothetical protein